MSIASVYSCTDPIDGPIRDRGHRVRASYLIADLTVVCYQGWHIYFLVSASICTVVYAVGIPATVVCVTAFRSPIQRDEKKKLRWAGCARRNPREYGKASVRARFAFLFNGYATDRSGVVVAWEALVMLRKLAVLLAGSLVRDPYLQILVALLILVVSCVATAFIQPYEAGWLNVLDTLGLFVLIVTQILSIFYFYVESAELLTIDPLAFERIVTVALCALNVAVLAVFATGYTIEALGLRAKCARRWSAVLKVASPTATAAALALEVDDRVGSTDDGEGQATQFWFHPSGVAVAQPPRKVNELGIWVWRAPNLDVAVSASEPQLLLAVRNAAALSSGDEFRMMNTATRVLSELETRLPDVGGWCSKEPPPQHDPPPHLPRTRACQLPTSGRGRTPGDPPSADGAHPGASEHGAKTVNPLRVAPQERLHIDGGGAEMKLVVDAEHGANTVNPLRVAPQERLHIDGGGAEMMLVVDASAQSVVRTKERWAKVFSTTNQAFYWRHDTTGEMTWDKPQGWVEPGLPVGWTEVPDMASGHSYYHNASTDSTQWKRPHGELP